LAGDSTLRTRFLSALLVSLIALIAASLAMLPGVQFWDTGELQAVGPLMGTTHPTGFPTYVLLGWLALSRVSVLKLGVAAVASSVLFFAVSNFGTWLTSGMYSHDIAGLEACYVAAIPFFQNTLAGDLFYVTLLFGGLRVAELLVPTLAIGDAQAA
jgi:hypothetical protein